MFKTILVAVDGSDHALKAVELASDIAAKYDARMVLLHVLLPDSEPEELLRLAEIEGLSTEARSELKRIESMPRLMASAGVGFVQLPVPRHLLEDIGRHIQESSKRAAERKGVKKISLAMETGDPAKRILESAKREDADLIVVGSRGLSDLKGLFLGSVSHKVSQHATCTCITVK